jgi:hypothetical protein
MGLTYLEAMPEEPSLFTPSNQEFAVNSTLYRGYYHPSPVYDLIVGNTKRGRLVRNPVTAQLSHCYYYDDQRRLLRVDSYYQGRISHTEYLKREGQMVYGFTVDCSGRLAAVCRETYDNGRIASLSLMHCVCTHGQYRCFEYLEEHYRYDSEGLCTSNFVVYRPGSVHVIYEIYEFQRENGRFVSYVYCMHPDKGYRVAKSKQRKA